MLMTVRHLTAAALHDKTAKPYFYIPITTKPKGPRHYHAGALSLLLFIFAFHFRLRNQVPHYLTCDRQTAY